MIAISREQALSEKRNLENWLQDMVNSGKIEYFAIENLHHAHPDDSVAFQGQRYNGTTVDEEISSHFSDRDANYISLFYDFDSMSVGTPDGSIEQMNIKGYWEKHKGNLQVPQAPQMDGSRPSISYDEELRNAMNGYFKYFMPYVTRIQ